MAGLTIQAHPPLYVGTDEQRMVLNERLMANQKWFNIHGIAEHYGVSEERLRERNPHLPPDFDEQVRNGKTFELVIPERQSEVDQIKSRNGLDPSGESKYREIAKKRGWGPTAQENFAAYCKNVEKADKREMMPKGVEWMRDQLMDKCADLSGPAGKAVEKMVEMTPQMLKDLYDRGKAGKLSKDVDQIREILKEKPMDLKQLTQRLGNVECWDEGRILNGLSAYSATFGTDRIEGLKPPPEFIPAVIYDVASGERRRSLQAQL